MHHRIRWIISILMGLQLLMVSAGLAEAGEGSVMVPHHSQVELKSAYRAAARAMEKGPANIPLASRAVLKLPAGFGFVPARQARHLMQVMGNPAGTALQGLIFPTTKQTTNWCIVVNYVDSGHIQDDDAGGWSADHMLMNIRSVTEGANEGRRAQGFPEIEVLNWVEKPQYVPATHQLVWAVASRNKEEPKGADHCINYNILALGRSGYISLNLVTDLSAAGRLEPIARSLAGDLSFNAGSRYTDFDASIDRVAEYGLAALVAGAAAQKLGLFALIASFLAKFGKAIGVLMAAGIGIMGKKIWVRKQSGRQNVA